VTTICDAQMVDKCLCSAIAPCKQAFKESVIPCIDSCQGQLSALGASPAALRACFSSKQGMLQSVISCVEGDTANSCANSPGGPKIPKRYPETLKIAALGEIKRMLSQMGVGGQSELFMSVGQKMFGCVNKCMNRKAGSCDKKRCGLDLPADSVLVQQAKQCAIAGGLNTANVQQICQCAVNAGVKGLAGICPKIRI